MCRGAKSPKTASHARHSEEGGDRQMGGAEVERERRQFFTRMDVQGEDSASLRGWLIARANSLAQRRSSTALRESWCSATASCEWLAELALQALGCMQLGIVRIRTHPHTMELVAAAGMATRSSCESEQGLRPTDWLDAARPTKEPAFAEPTSCGRVVLAAPIHDGERLIGRLVAVYRSRLEVAFNEALPILQATADLARIVLAHDQLVRESARHRHQLDQLRKRMRRIE